MVSDLTSHTSVKKTFISTFDVHFDSFRLQVKRHSDQHHDFNTKAHFNICKLSLFDGLLSV